MSELDQSLVAWLNANRLAWECRRLEDINDGTLLMELLAQL